MGFRKGEGGRPRGAKNKTTVAAKEAIQATFDELGGVSRLVAWVQEDPANARVFYGTIWPKVIPLQLDGTLKVSLADLLLGRDK